MTLTGKNCTAFAFAFLMVGAAWAQTQTRLQVGVFSDSAKAQAIAKNLNDNGLGPAQVLSTSAGNKVLTRAFPSYAEANLTKPRLRELGFGDTFAVSAAPETSQVQARSSGAEVPALAFDGKPDFSTVKIDFKQLADQVTSSSQITGETASESSADTGKVQPSPRESLRKIPDEASSEQQLADKVLLPGRKADAADAISAGKLFLQKYASSSKAPSVHLKLAYWLVADGKRDEAKTEFSALIENYPGTLEAGEAHLRLGYLSVDDPDRGLAALQHFRKVATAEIPVSPANRVDAIMRCAALYHRGKDLEASRQLYLQVEQADSVPAEIKAFAMLQRSGLVMEQAWNGKATFAESRQITQDLLNKFPDAHPQTRATAAIIQIESHVHEKDYQKALDASERLEPVWSAAPEAPIAIYWISKSYAELGQTSQAASLLESVLENKADTGKRFRDVNMETSARRLASDVYREMGNEQKAQAVLTAE